MTIACIITTIQKPTDAVRSLAAAIAPLGAPLVIVGDRKGPPDYDLDGSEFLSLDTQLASRFDLARALPVGHYTRKNVGYLHAIANGAECLYETDDDNAPLASWSVREEHCEATALTESGWINVYRCFSDERIWPRGLPLDAINAPIASRQADSPARKWAPIQQGLANGSPDVDAIWRLVLDAPFHFDDRASIWLGEGAWCPFNSQSTWWWPAAYPLLYLPSFCSFRMTDIWRSFIAQRCLWAMDAGLVFHGAEVHQDRNEHDLMRDFADEVPGYLTNRRIAEVLADLELDQGSDREIVLANLRACYVALCAAGIFPEAELALVDLWSADFDAVVRGHVAHATDDHSETAKRVTANRVSALAGRAKNFLRRALDLARTRRSLLILDDYFPNLLTSFRISEFNDYLERFPDALVVSYSPTFDEDFVAYQAEYPHLASRVLPARNFRALAGRLAYCVFINNAFKHLAEIEKYGTPLVFTLYPGGGFGLDNVESDAALRRVCASPSFRKVIVTQAVTRAYLLRKKICDEGQIEFIYGGVFPASYWNQHRAPRTRYLEDKQTLDVCFVAFKYAAGGVDKGYDRFVAAAKLLAPGCQDIRFHVVGNFDASDLPVEELVDRITFYGMQRRDFFPAFYAQMDIIVSPNVPGRVATPGGFDGFPTGCCIEAGLSGTAVFCTDELSLNTVFVPHEEIVIISPEPEVIAATITAYRSHPDRLKSLSAKGQLAFSRNFSESMQLAPRRELWRRHARSSPLSLTRLLGFRA